MWQTEIMTEIMNGLSEIISQLLEENRILREGLEFYSDNKSWAVQYNFEDKEFTLIDEDSGKKARETLSKADEVGKVEE